MKLFGSKYRVESARYKNYDYSSNGAYFITVCTKDMKYCFGNIKNEAIILSEIGKVAEKFWREIPEHFSFVILDEFVMMPNHIHGILFFNKETQDIAKTTETQDIASLRNVKNKFGPQSNNLASVIRGFKIGVKKYATMHNINFAWQLRYYDHIIRNEDDMNRIKGYIINNPLNWETDRNNIKNLNT